MPKSKAPTLEDSMAKLEVILRELEEDDIELERSLKLFEEGMQLSRTAQTILRDAQQKVQTLTEVQGDPVAQTMDAETK